MTSDANAIDDLGLGVIRSAMAGGGYPAGMPTDKTGAATTVSADSDRFTIAVEDQTVGHAEFADREKQRIFTHTEVNDQFEGRGLATILIGEALQQTRDAGMRIVAVCPMVANYVEKHDEFNDLVDPVDRDVERWLADR